jgi:hypothetical protein
LVLPDLQAATYYNFVAYRAGDDIMVEIPLHYEAGDAKGTVRFDQDGKVAGLAIRPANWPGKERP